MRTIDTVVVGAGPAGLAVGKELRERDVPFEILEKESDVASKWRHHYERLHLHTAKRYSSLPGMPFPSNTPTYPSRAAVVDYMTAYAERFHLKPRFGVNVERIERNDQGTGWRVRTSEGLIGSTRVVIAAGYNSVPSQPRWPGMDAYTGEVLHSSAYRNGDRWKGKRVLVVGAGNSGAEIALDLVERGARIDLCVRGKLHVTLRDTLGMPTPLPTILLTKLPLRLADAIARATLRQTVGDLSKWGIEAPDMGPIRGIVERARIPVIDVGTLARIKSGEIVVRKGIERFEPDGVTFVDGQRHAYDAIVLATGFRPGLDGFLDDAESLLDAYGRASQGGAELRPGLYLVGYTQPATGLLREIGFEARRTAADIAKKRALVGSAGRALVAIGFVVACAGAAVSASCLVPPMGAQPSGHGAKAVAPPSSAASSEPSSPNWLKNSDFEDRDKPEWEGGQIVQPGHGSKQAMLIENAKPAWNAATQMFGFGSDATDLVLSGWMRTENVVSGKESWQQARMVVDFTNERGEQVGGWQASAALVQGTSDWRHFQYTYSIPRGAKFVKVEVGLPNIVGKVWFDDVTAVLNGAGGNVVPAVRVETATTNTSDWYKYEPPSDPFAPPLDLSFLNEKPAGKHGFVRAKGARFAFEDGTPIRFWGTNLVGPHAFPTHDLADRVARRLAREGVNLVRLHHMDASWAKPNIFDPSANDTQTFSEDSVDRLFYLIAALKKLGIYVYPDLLVHRKFRAKDKVVNYEDLEDGAKGVAHFSRRIIELNQLYAKMLLTRKNKYTGLSLAEDPVMVGTEIVNESSIFSGFGEQNFPPAYEAELQSLYQAWGGRGNITRFAYDWNEKKLRPVRNAENAQQSLEFMVFEVSKTNREMRAFLTSLGVRALLAGSNIGLPIAGEILVNSKLDFMDTHFYWDHPQVWKMKGSWAELDAAPFDNRPQLENLSGGMIASLAEWRVKDKPLIVTEWNDCFPNQYRSEGPVLAAAYASLQDFSGMLQFSHSLDPAGSRRMHPFEIDTRPDNEVLFQAGALIFRNGYISPSEKEIVEPISDGTLLGGGSKSEWLSENPFLPYVARVFKSFVGREKASRPDLTKIAPLFDASHKTATSLGGQLLIDAERGVLKIDAPDAQGFVGALGGAKLATKNVELAIDARNAWAATLVVSLDRRALTESSRMLVAAVGRAENAGQVYNATHTALKNPGHLPILMEGVNGSVTLKLGRGDFHLTPLDKDGQPKPELSLTKKDDGISFAVSNTDKTPYYVLEARR